MERPTPDDLHDGVIPLLEFTPKVGTSGQRGSVRIISWTPEKPEGLTEKIDMDDIESGDVIVYTDIKFIADKGIEYHRVTDIIRDEKHAKALVKAELKRRAEKMVTGEVEIPGNPHIRMGYEIWIQLKTFGDIGRQYTGLYTVTKAKHELSKDGYRTKLELRRPGLTKV
jgi:phage protein D